jgi:prolyl-tRNA editing enzyme YbaK/EbsC (Cys-tRNA(Pro) deacylase)
VTRDYCAQLDALGIRYTVVAHPPLRTIAEAIDYLGIAHADRLPTLILKADGADLVVLLRGDCRADFKSIKRLLHIRDLRLATAEEFVALTGQIPGAARPYLPGIPTLIDKQVLDQERLIGGSGSFTSSIWYRTADLVRIPASQVAAIAVPTADRDQGAH